LSNCWVLGPIPDYKIILLEDGPSYKIITGYKIAQTHCGKSGEKSEKI
jgi:hypothetical protein